MMNTVVLLLPLVGAVVATSRGREDFQRTDRRTLHPMAPTVDIPDLAVKLGATTLVDFVKKAGLTDTLSGTGPLTVFAPTNEAFQYLSPGLADNITALRSILMYHVIKGDAYSSQLKNDLVVPSLLQGESIRLNLYSHDGQTVATAEGSPITLPDQNATNGVIHVVSRVVIPPAVGSIASFLLSGYGKNFSTLLSAIVAADLADTFAGNGPFTLFAPTNDAFARVPRETLEKIFKSRSELVKVLTYHVVESTQWSAGLYNNEVFKTIESSTITVHVEGGPGHSPTNVQISFGTSGHAQVVYPDIATTNGVIHVIDTVMLPPNL